LSYILQEKKKPVTIGLYPLLFDETCWFLAIDFDKKSWQEDTTAFLETCLELEVPASLERHVQEMVDMFGFFSMNLFWHEQPEC
jgi:hypothetical protein